MIVIWEHAPPSRLGGSPGKEGVWAWSQDIDPVSESTTDAVT